MGIASKRKGWRFQYPTRNFYHRVCFKATTKKVHGYVEHSSGRVVVSASSREMAIGKHLYSTIDVSAAENVGRVLAQRCMESGITNMIVNPIDASETSEKFQVFQNALTEGGVELSEPEEVLPDYEPGIDYADQYECSDLQRRQRLVNQPGQMAEYGQTKRKVGKKYKPDPRYVDVPDFDVWNKRE